MALTKTEVRNGRLGQFFDQFVDVALGTYATGGLAVDPKLFGFNTLLACVVVGGNAASGGYHVIWDSVNNKLVVYRSAGATPAGTVAAPVFTGSALATHAHDVLVKGSASGGIDEPIGVEGADTLAKDAATDRTITGAASATKGGVIANSAGTPAGTNSAPAFTGTAIAAAALVEVSNGVNLAAITVRLRGSGF
jgi:hypothetical protein